MTDTHNIKPEQAQEKPWRKQWVELSGGMKIGIVAMGCVGAFLWIAYVFTVAWYFYPALEWWKIGAAFVAFLVVMRGFQAFAPDFSKKAAYALKPVVIIISLPVIVAFVVLMLAIVFAPGIVWLCWKIYSDSRSSPYSRTRPNPAPKYAVLLVAVMIAGMAGFVAIKRDNQPPEAAQAQTLDSVWK